MRLKMTSQSSFLDKKAGNRKVGYTDEEIFDFVVAFSSISQDGEIGADQDGETFWNRVHAIHVIKYPNRTASALLKRWRIIAAEMSYFSSIVMRYKRQAAAGGQMTISRKRRRISKRSSNTICR